MIEVRAELLEVADINGTNLALGRHVNNIVGRLFLMSQQFSP